MGSKQSAYNSTLQESTAAQNKAAGCRTHRDCSVQVRPLHCPIVTGRVTRRRRVVKNIEPNRERAAAQDLYCKSVDVVPADNAARDGAVAAGGGRRRVERRGCGFEGCVCVCV